jgi:hypothetical protein
MLKMCDLCESESSRMFGIMTSYHYDNEFGNECKVIGKSLRVMALVIKKNKGPLQGGGSQARLKSNQ